MSFYWHLKYLNEIGLIEKFNKKDDEMTRIKFLCNLEKNAIDELAKSVAFVNYEDFLV